MRRPVRTMLGRGVFRCCAPITHSQDRSMVNRLNYLMDHPPEPGRETTFYEVETVHNIYVVTLQGGLEIWRQFDALPAPRWLEFRDLFGARQQTLAAQLVRISESTLETRHARRLFSRERDKEDEQDKEDGTSPWTC